MYFINKFTEQELNTLFEYYALMSYRIINTINTTRVKIDRKYYLLNH